MADKRSQARRERDRKPDDTHGQHLRRDEGQAPSEGQNSEREDPWRSGRNKGMGRRGEKNRRQIKRVNQQRMANERDRVSELKKRPRLAKQVKEKIMLMAALCEQGIAISAHKEGSRAHSPHMFVAQGRVTYSRTQEYGPRYRVVITVESVQPWGEMSCRFLRSIRKKLWRPHEPKSILDQIVISTGGYEVEELVVPMTIPED